MIIDNKRVIWFTLLLNRFGFASQSYLNQNYTLSIGKIDLPNKKQFLGNKEQCRYCRSYNKNINSVKQRLGNSEILPEQTRSFKKIAHALPTLIGNVNIISKDECDTCNERFNKLENQLVSFLGVNRTLNKIKGRTGIPKTKVNRHEFVDLSGQDLIIATYEKSELYEEKDNVITITSKKKYIPIEVHKCFVKMALSVLPLEKLRHFSKTIEWLLNDYPLDKGYHNQLYIYETKWPVKNMFSFVSVDVYERKFDRIDIPYMFSRICFNNFAFQFPIPLSSMDIMVNNFDIPIAVKRETQFEELLDNNELWMKILKETITRKRDLSNHLRIEEIDKQHFSSIKKSEIIERNDLPENILKYLKDNNFDSE